MLGTWSWTDPPWDTVRISILSCHQLISYNVYIDSLDLRSSCELGMCKGFTLGLSNATPWKGSYKGSFGFVTKHAASHGWSRWDLPSVQRRDISWPLEWPDLENVWPYSRLSVNRFRDSVSWISRKMIELQQGSQALTLSLINIVRQREQVIQYCGRFVWYDLYVYLGVDTSC